MVPDIVRFCPVMNSVSPGAENLINPLDVPELCDALLEMRLEVDVEGCVGRVELLVFEEVVGKVP